MIPVDQDIFTDPEKGTIGNCFQASIASLLEIPLSEVPHFYGDGEQQGWFKFREWLRERYDMEVATFPPHTGGAIKFLEGCYYLVSGWTVRGTNHMCVGRDGHVIHDPHPSKAGLLSQETFTVLIPTDPARLRDRA